MYLALLRRSLDPAVPSKAQKLSLSASFNNQTLYSDDRKTDISMKIYSRWKSAFAIPSRTSLHLKVVHWPTDLTQVASRSAQIFHMVPVGERQPQEEQEVNWSSIRDPRTTRVRKPRPWRIPRAIQEDWAKNSRKATKRGAPYSKRVYGVASPDAPKKARKIRYVRCPSINIFFIRNCNQISWAGASVTLTIPVKSLPNKNKTVTQNEIKTTWLSWDQAVAPVKTLTITYT